MNKYCKFAAIFCSIMMVLVLCSCSKETEKSGDNIFETVPPRLYGTWTEKNNLFTDVLTLRENGEFTFQSHLTYCNGSGNFKYQRTTTPAGQNNTSGVTFMDILILYYSGRSSETMKIVNLTDNKLEMTDRYDNVFHFRK